MVKFFFETSDEYRHMGVPVIKTMPKIDCMVWSHLMPVDTLMGYNVGASKQEVFRRADKCQKMMRTDPELFVKSCSYYAQLAKEECVMEVVVYMDPLMSSYPDHIHKACNEFLSRNIDVTVRFPSGVGRKDLLPVTLVGESWDQADTPWVEWDCDHKGFIGWSCYSMMGNKFTRPESLKPCTIAPGPIATSIGNEYIRLYLYGEVSIEELVNHTVSSFSKQAHKELALFWLNQTKRDVDNQYLDRFTLPDKG